MRCLPEDDLTAYAAVVLPFLHRDPVGNNLACTVLEARRQGLAPVTDGTRWLRVIDHHGSVAAVALHTPPHPLLLTDAPFEAIDAVVDYLLQEVPDLPEVTGPEQAVARFTRRWAAATGTPATVTMRQRLHRLDAVSPPSGVPGHLRRATAADRALLVEWCDGFAADVHPHAPAPDSGPIVDRALARGDALWLWQVAAEPVTMVGIAPQVVGVARIAPVYTPPPVRGRGYATAATAAVSQWALTQGARACMLYTDLANPTSNRIYQRIGYRPVTDAAEWRLRPAAGHSTG